MPETPEDIKRRQEAEKQYRQDLQRMGQPEAMRRYQDRIRVPRGDEELEEQIRTARARRKTLRPEAALPPLSGGRSFPRLSLAEPRFFRHGGRVRKAGMAIVHRGERIIPARKRARR